MPPDEPPHRSLQPREGGAAGTGVLALITATVFGFATIVAMLGPILLDLAADLGVSLGRAGLLAAAMGVPWALGAPFAGLLSDRLGRRPMIVLALGGMGAGCLGSAFAPNFEVLLLLRLLTGVFGAFGPASLFAAVGDLFPAERRGMAMGWLNMGVSLATVIGVPLIGVVGGLFGWRWSFAVTGLVLVALAVLIWLTFPAPTPVGRGAGVLVTYRAVFKVPLISNVMLANLLERAVFNVAILYLPPFLMLSYGLGAAEVAPTLVLVAAGTIGGNLAGGWLGDRAPKAATFAATQILTALIGLALFSLPVGLIASTINGALFGLANAAGRPPMLALSTELSTRHRGAVLGLVSLTNQGGVVLGSALGGLLISLGGYPLLAAATALGAALAAALALPLTRQK